MFMENTFPKAWRRKYSNDALLIRDPVVLWFTAQTGAVRWSEIGDPDRHGVLERAGRYGLKYGAVFSTEYDRKRHFMTVSRSDRELSDAEIQNLEQRFSVWTRCVMDGIPHLTETEIEVLRAASAGKDQAESAVEQDVSVSTIKQRQSRAREKLNAKNLTEAVHFATAARLI
nr:LuxR family transcriptional regulator [Paracoccus laeviglucosivorans]